MARVRYRSSGSFERLICSLVSVLLLVHPAAAGSPTVEVYLWFDTEDYILPEADGAALRLARWLTERGIRGTFKLVGEKARVLEQRGREDVIQALKKHDIGFHTNFHSVQPTPALYLSYTNWDEGVREFLRREGPGVRDVARIFGMHPSCYGQPGSSWGPQQFGAMKRWGIPVYLDAGNHVSLNGNPFWYCGILNLYALKGTTRTGLQSAEQLRVAKKEFERLYNELLEEGGGPISIVYHPCEFVHAKFWDGVNFSRGANPPRERWVVPPKKSPEEIETAFRIFQEYVAFIQAHERVRFATARDAVHIYPDHALGRHFRHDELLSLARDVEKKGVTYAVLGDDVSLSAAETMYLLCQAYVGRLEGRQELEAKLDFSPLGPTSNGPKHDRIGTDGSQFNRTCTDVLSFIRYHRRIPAAVWLGSTPCTPESFLVALATILARDRLPEPDETITLRRVGFPLAKHVRDDEPGLWGWVIFPPGFHSPHVMQLAKWQAWTLKPALRDNDAAAALPRR